MRLAVAPSTLILLFAWTTTTTALVGPTTSRRFQSALFKTTDDAAPSDVEFENDDDTSSEPSKALEWARQQSEEYAKSVPRKKYVVVGGGWGGWGVSDDVSSLSLL